MDYLKKIIYRELLPEISSDYSLLDIPLHGNIGDSLIAEGEIDFLKQAPFKLLFKASLRCSIDEIPKRGILLFNGGGNFGDLWPGSNEFRRSVISDRTSQKVIIFPQSVYYSKIENLNEDVKVFNKHPDLIICARDIVSFDFLKLHFKNNKILLVPDMAFYLNLDRIGCSQGLCRKDGTRKVLLLFRDDLESSFSLREAKDLIYKAQPNSKLFVADWPTLKSPRAKFQIFNNKFLIRFLRQDKSNGWNLMESIDEKRFNFDLSRKGIDFINSYDVVVTTRLHGLILGILLNKHVVGLDNAYGKLSSFYNTWLCNFDRCEIISK